MNFIDKTYDPNSRVNYYQHLKVASEERINKIDKAVQKRYKPVATGVQIGKVKEVKLVPLEVAKRLEPETYGALPTPCRAQTRVSAKTHKFTRRRNLTPNMKEVLKQARVFQNIRNQPIRK